MRPFRPLALLLACSLPASALNVVFILADDLGYGELGCFGQKKIRTPHIDRLAAEGMRLTHHYTGAPVCAPARCNLLTGKHAGHAEIRGNRQASVSFPEFKEGQHPISADALTLATVFKKAGYSTGAIGKWGLGPVGSSGDPNRHGFDLFYGYNCQAIAHSYFPRHLWRNGGRVEINATPIPGHAKQAEGEVTMEKWFGGNYAPDLLVGEAERFIGANSEKPFFLYLAFIEPHVAMHPPAELVGSYPEAWDDRPYRGESGYLPHPRPRAGYAAMITGLDRHVGRVRAALEKAGVLDDTLIVFTSDNGTTHDGPAGTRFGVGGCDAEFFDSTGGLRGRKGSLHEGGIRVPAIVRLPGKIGAGTTEGTPGYFPDWFPTLCSAAGIGAPSGLDGADLWPVLTGTGDVKRETPMLWVFADYGGQVAVRLDEFKVMRRGLKTGTPGPWEVYDIRNDPGETENLAGKRPDLVERARDVLKRGMSPNPVFPVPLPD